jgi:hypothetical protein
MIENRIRVQACQVPAGVKIGTAISLAHVDDPIRPGRSRNSLLGFPAQVSRKTLNIFNSLNVLLVCTP